MSKQFGIDIRLGDLDLTQLVKKAWHGANLSVNQVIGLVGGSGLALISALVTLALIPVVSFYFLRDWGSIIAKLQRLVPRYQEQTLLRLAREADQVLASFLRGQLFVMLCLGIFYSIALSIIGVQLSFVIGMLSGLLSFVPYLGFIIGFLLASLTVLMQHPEGVYVLYVLGVYGAGQVLESFVLTPLLLGGKIGLHPVAVIFAILAGGQLFGFTGVLLALPVAAVLLVVLRFLQGQYIKSEFYQSQPKTSDS